MIQQRNYTRIGSGSSDQGGCCLLIIILAIVFAVLIGLKWILPLFGVN